MTSKQIIRKLEALKARQAKLRDEMRELYLEIGEHFDNAEEAVGAQSGRTEA